VGVPEAISFFAPFFIPKLFADGYTLKEYIRSDEFRRHRISHGDVHAVDVLFNKAMRLSWDNTYEALLLSLVATMDHRRFGIRIPVVGPLLWVPLSSEFPEEFELRVNALPSRLYDDSPRDPAGDRDKLQHFFGSALIAYLFESGDAARRVGDLVETYEEKIIVDGVLDERDLRANMQGQEFGMHLLNDRSARPSTFLGQSTRHRTNYSKGCDPGSPDSLMPTLEDR